MSELAEFCRRYDKIILAHIFLDTVYMCTYRKTSGIQAGSRIRSPGVKVNCTDKSRYKPGVGPAYQPGLPSKVLLT